MHPRLPPAAGVALARYVRLKAPEFVCRQPIPSLSSVRIAVQLRVSCLLPEAYTHVSFLPLRLLPDTHRMS